MDSTKKYPVNASGVRDGLSGDLLASSQRCLVFYGKQVLTNNSSLLFMYQ